MGVIGSILGMGNAVRGVGETVGSVAEVFVGNEAERDAAAAQILTGAVGQFSAEFAHPGGGRFDSFVNGLNRLPRPMLALATLGLFVYAMAAPAGFSVRMQGLALVPEPLWWLLGAIVSFYFGARELHHQRLRSLQSALPRLVAGAVGTAPDIASLAAPASIGALVPLATPIAMPVEPVPAAAAPTPVVSLVSTPICAAPAATRANDPEWNAALEEWRQIGR